MVRCSDFEKCGNEDCMHFKEHEPIRISEDAHCTDGDFCLVIWGEVHCQEVVKQELILQPA